MVNRIFLTFSRNEAHGAERPFQTSRPRTFDTPPLPPFDRYEEFTQGRRRTHETFE
ncbi:MAG: hypothetical protein IPP40_14900 [bacterium]|nr:hypothetical protein [bacterium]